MEMEARRSAVTPPPKCGGGGWLTPTWWVIDSLRSDSVGGWLIPSVLSLSLNLSQSSSKPAEHLGILGITKPFLEDWNLHG